MMKKRTEAWPRIAVIGGGQMARALVGGWLARGAPAEHLAVADPAEAQRDWLARRFQKIEAQGVRVAVFFQRPQLDVSLELRVGNGPALRLPARPASTARPVLPRRW